MALLYRIILLVLLMVSSGLTWVHSFEHLHVEGETECAFGVYANLVGVEHTEAFAHKPVLLEIPLTFREQTRLKGLQSVKFPFRNKAPPAI